MIIFPFSINLLLMRESVDRINKKAKITWIRLALIPKFDFRETLWWWLGKHAAKDIQEGRTNIWGGRYPPLFGKEGFNGGLLMTELVRSSKEENLLLFVQDFKNEKLLNWHWVKKRKKTKKDFAFLVERSKCPKDILIHSIVPLKAGGRIGERGSQLFWIPN